jgi:hypothetical protein
MLNSKQETKQVLQHLNSRGFFNFKKLDDPRCRGLMDCLFGAGKFQLRFDWDGFSSMIPHKALKTKGAFGRSQKFLQALMLKGRHGGGSYVLSSKNLNSQGKSKKSRYDQVIESAVLG